MAEENAPESDEEYKVYVRSGETEQKFIEFCKSLGKDIEISWKDTHEW